MYLNSEDAFITFGLSKDTSTAENIEPSFINHDWLQINAPKKMVWFKPKSNPSLFYYVRAIFCRGNSFHVQSTIQP